MNADEFATLPESAFALPSSYYASVEVIETQALVDRVDWVVLREWDSHEPTLIGFNYQDARMPR